MNLSDGFEKTELKVNNRGSFIKVNTFKYKSIMLRFRQKTTFSAIIFNTKENSDSYQLIKNNVIVSIDGYGLFKINIQDNIEYKKVYGEQIDLDYIDDLVFMMNELSKFEFKPINLEKGDMCTIIIDGEKIPVVIKEKCGEEYIMGHVDKNNN
jgi:hypothetical protein